MSCLLYANSRRNGTCPRFFPGGVALGTLVSVANTSGETIDRLHKALDAERARNAQLVEEHLRLTKACEQAKLELRLERQNKFATRQQKQQDAAVDTTTQATATAKKRGAPVGHPGWFRAKPTAFDWSIDVPAPAVCPHCRREEIGQVPIRRLNEQDR